MTVASAAQVGTRRERGRWRIASDVIKLLAAEEEFELRKAGEKRQDCIRTGQAAKEQASGKGAAFGDQRKEGAGGDSRGRSGLPRRFAI